MQSIYVLIIWTFSINSGYSWSNIGFWCQAHTRGRLGLVIKKCFCVLPIWYMIYISKINNDITSISSEIDSY